MPFKFGLGKARRYNVSSKNAYVVCVHMLDNNLIECTLTSEGTGHDCLQNIAQRIDLHEFFYFGLRYVNKKLQFRWLDLDRPLKRQLDKHAHSPLLYFRVMFFVGDVQSIRDETAKRQYYLQLKMDVIDGKYPCTNKQAVLLAAYSLKAEQREREEKYTVEDLKENAMLPRNISQDERTTNALLEEVLALHSNLKSISPDVAEMQYIVETQQLEDYGLEYYPAKDDSGQELLIGASFIGIFVKRLDNKPANYYQWAAINNLSYNKRNFKIETTLSEKSVHFQMDDPDLVKYVFKMCSVQHKFYHAKQHSVSPVKSKPKSVSLAAQDDAVQSDGSTGPMPDIQQIVQSHDIQQELQQTVEVPSDIDDYSPATQRTENYYENAQVLLDQQQQQQQQLKSPQQQQAQQALPDADQVESPPFPNSLPPASPVYTPVPPQVEETIPGYGPVRLPSYRPAPDYETIMKRRMDYVATHQQEHPQFDPSVVQGMPNIGNSQVYNQPELLTYSQPEMRHVMPMQRYIIQSHVHPHHRYLGQNYYTDGNGRAVDRSNSLNIHPTYSTPDLHQLSIAAVRPASVQRINTVTAMDYKPPPPYPRTYNSFPDLASMQANTVASESPDLISRKNNVGSPVVQNPHKSVDNLAADMQHYQLAKQNSYQEQEVFITDPPYQANISATESLNQPSNDQYYGSENPYENLPPAVYGQKSSPKQEPEFIQCLDTSKVSDCTDSVSHSQTSSIDVSGPVETSIQVMIQDSPRQDENHNRKEKEIIVAYDEVDSIDISSPPIPTPEKFQPEDNIITSTPEVAAREDPVEIDSDKRLSLGPLKLAALNGLSLSRGSVLETSCDEQRAPKDERRKLLENRIEDGQVFQEFEQVEKKKASLECSVGQKQENMKYNRFKDVLPYDNTRVCLASTKENPSGYINASHVTMNVSNRKFSYIASQGPTDKTAAHFWQMIWEQDVEVIAMLTGLQEFGQQKCQRYWPEQRGAKNKHKYGQFEVFLKFSQDSGSYMTSTLILLHTKSKKQRQIWHLQYTDWPDHGCPEDTWNFQAFVDELESVTRHGERGPVVVHCSAGVGRSGVLILTQLMRACLEHNQNVEVCSVLSHMRGQRMHMVQTAAQYHFVYRCLVDFLKSARLI